MKYINGYEIFENQSRPVVTFDFDGVMHTGVYPGTIHPYPDPKMWTPNEEMIDLLRYEAEVHDVYIVSARNSLPNGSNPWIEKFVKDNNLPVKGIVCTDDRPKRPYLEKLKSIRHYDDNPNMKYEMRNSDIEFVFVKDGMISESESHNADKVWYHGTDNKFDKFDITKGKKGPSAFGVWFTDDPELATVFGSNVMKCRISFSNPKVITMDKWDEIRMDHAKDTEYFTKWKSDLIRQGHDALFIKERTSKLGSFTVKDGNMVCMFDDANIEIIK